MKLLALLRGDVRFQFRYGFYLLYLFFSVFYIGLLAAFPQDWRPTAAVLMVFSDPAAMGLFFMGAIVLYEKSERVLDSLAIAPIKVRDYVFSKLLSLALISTAVALAIGAFGGILASPLYFLAGVLVGSSLFSALGLLVAARIHTLNEFIVFTVLILPISPNLIQLYQTHITHKTGTATPTSDIIRFDTRIRQGMNLATIAIADTAKMSVT